METLLNTTPALPSRLPLARSATNEAGMSEEYLARRFGRTAKQVEPITYELTRDPGMLHQYYRLREQMFIHVWGLKQFSGKKDEFDDTSDIIIARIGNNVIGGCRLTFSDTVQPLPMEDTGFQLSKHFPVLDKPENAYLEVSRLAILPDFQNSVVMLELTRQMFKRAAEKKAKYAFALAPVPLARSYRKTTTVFGGPVWQICNNVNVPDREEYEGIKMKLSVLDLAPIYQAKAARKAKIQQNEMLVAG